MRDFTKKFIEFGQLKFGKHHGWKKDFANGLGISNGQLSNIISERNPIGPKIRERIRSIDPNFSFEEISNWQVGEPQVNYGVRSLAELSVDEQNEIHHLVKELIGSEKNERKKVISTALFLLKQIKK